MSTRKTLLFDLGGVIVRWVGIEALMDLKGLSRSEVLDKFAFNTIITAYEVGGCSDDEFIAALTSVFDLHTEPDEAKRLWKSWVEPAYDGVIETLMGLQDGYNVACLSNTNALHWERLKDHFDAETLFHHAFASHILRAAKPHAECYNLALSKMNIDAQDVIFFDDTQENIDTAHSLGMEAHLVDRSVGVLPVLKSLQIIS